MRKKIMIRAFLAEIGEDDTAGRFFSCLSEEQRRGVVDYVRRSFDEQEAAARSGTALKRLRAGRIDFI